MLKNNAQAEIYDVETGNPVILDVNFDDNYKDCVRITIGLEETIVKYTDLFSFMFTLATKEQQAKMIPVQQELGHQYMKQISVKLKKDMKEGEMMVVNVPINIPQIIEDEIKLSTPLPEINS
jgi:hypothetical protein